MISLQKIITKLKSLIDKNTADISAINGSLSNTNNSLNNKMERSKYKFVTYIVSSYDGDQTYKLIGPPANNYKPVAAANGDWDAYMFKITSVCWQPSKRAAVIWFDRQMSGDSRIDILWVNGYD